MKLRSQQLYQGSRNTSIGERGEGIVLSRSWLCRQEKSWQDVPLFSFLRLLLPLPVQSRKRAAVWVEGCEKRRRESGQRGKVGAFSHRGRVGRDGVRLFQGKAWFDN